jgi:hypothetical protein
LSAPAARLFVAVDPPASVREQLAAWARGVRASLGAGRSGGGRTLDSHTVQKHHDYRPLRQIIIRKYHYWLQNIMIIG